MSTPAPTPTETTTQTPAPEETESRLSRVLDETQTACRAEDGTFCGLLYDWTGNDELARWMAGILGTLGSILLIVVVGLALRFLVHRGITKLTDRIANGDVGVGTSSEERKHRRRLRPTALLESPLAGERRVQRARTIGSILKSVSTGVIATIVLLMVLAEFGINVGPLIAGAGVLGVALGFGSQTLVKDFLSGIFMIVEDQYGVGDVVDLGEASGSVEAVGLRVTRLRDVNGTVWYVRNGEILRVGNMSQGWARAVLDVAVAYGEDVGRVQDVLREIGAEIKADPDWGHLVMEDPEVWGVEALSADGVVLRLVVKTVPLEQWTVARELRRRIKGRFDREGIEIPFPQRTVWMRHEEDRGIPSPDGRPAQERHEKPTGGESQVAQDIDKRSDKGL
ncbi:MAG: mechanosensitive ion channel family protein [Actinomycetota bacterium]